MTMILFASSQLLALSVGCVSAAQWSEPFGEMTLLNSHSSVIQPGPTLDLAIATTARLTGGSALTPAELQLANRRKLQLEEARETNAVAHRVALELEREIGVLRGESTHEGLLLRFDAASFAKGTTQLNRASRERLDELLNFLRNHANRGLQIERLAQDARGTDTRRRLSVGRTEAIKYYLARSGVALNRLVLTVSNARTDALAHSDDEPVVRVIVEH